jgi:outer membrane protein assembly factor BamD
MMRNALSRETAGILFLALVLVLAPACKKKTVTISPDVASSDEALFRLGEESLKKDQEKGLLYLRQLIDAFPKSFYAQRAKLLIGDAYFKKGDEGSMILAAAEYREFIRAYPYSPSAAYCQLQIAKTFYKKALRPGRDQTKTTQALAEFKNVITAYPGSDQAKEAQEMIKDCEERLARHNSGIGIQYAKRKAYRAAQSRLTEIMTNYPDYSGMDEVYYYLGYSLFQLRNYDQSFPYLTKLVTDFPESGYVKKAVEMLKLIEASKVEKIPPPPGPR